MIVEVPIDGEPVPPDPLGLAGRVALGSPLDHATSITLGPHQLGDLLVFLWGPLRERGMSTWLLGHSCRRLCQGMVELQSAEGQDHHATASSVLQPSKGPLGTILGQVLP